MGVVAACTCLHEGKWQWAAGNCTCRLLAIRVQSSRASADCFTERHLLGCFAADAESGQQPRSLRPEALAAVKAAEQEADRASKPRLVRSSEIRSFN